MAKNESTIMLKKSQLFIFLMLLFVRCTPTDKNYSTPEHITSLENLTLYNPDKVAPLADVTLLKEVVFGAEDENLVGSVAGFAVDKRGYVFIGDDQQLVIHIFKPTGTYSQKIGAPGEGPGEFRSMNYNLNISTNLLYVSDPAQRRINVYSLSSLTPSTTIPLRSDQWDQVNELKGTYPGTFLVLDEQTLLLSFSSTLKLQDLDEHHSVYQQKKYYYKIDAEGNLQSGQLLEFKDARTYSFRIEGMYVSFSYPFLSRPLLVSNGRQLYTAQTNEFLIKVYNTEGSYVRAFYYSIKKKVLTREQAVAASGDTVMQNLAEKIKLPPTWPVLHEMLIDDKNRLWISTVAEDREVYKWWVLKNSGELLATFIWPRSKPIEKIKDNKLFTRETNKEGLTTIVRYKVSFEPR